MMRRSTAAVVATLSLVLWVAPAGALALRAHTISGSITGGSWSFEETGSECPAGAELRVTGAGDISPFGSSSFVAAQCYSTADVDTFVLTAPDGIVRGTIASLSFAIARQFVQVQFDVTITGGTGTYAGASGELSADLEEFAYEVPLHGPVTGEVAYGPPMPTSKTECDNGGWRTLADDQNRQFKNQGQCVAFVAQQHHMQ